MCVLTSGYIFMKLFQPSIFEAPSICYNRAVKKLEELDPHAARISLNEFQGYAPDKNLEIEFAMADLLDDWTLRDAIDTDPETAMDIWEQWCHDVGISSHEVNGQQDVTAKVRKALFRKISHTMLNVSGLPRNDRFITGGRAVKCLMLGGMWDEALKLCRQTLPHSEKPGRIMGYMGDCTYTLGMTGASRDAYLQACIAGPEEIDIESVQDPEIRELLTDPEYICDENDIPQGPWREDINWAAAIGVVSGIFPLISTKNTNSAIKIEEIFYRRPEDRYTEGQAFAAGLILSIQDFNAGAEPAGTARSVTDIRRITREKAPELFGMVLERYRQR